ncbi:hypothetical protein [Lichenibacterium ramalinae]|uniref:Antifreeze protein n=1 Tax=Lichenibacterium ramalinae TaxID=2316527 RepID=A0A4Q2RCM0_9HYPH|nr:hypothetical protein [Lichenibacterium ramalinae]RYB04928.1 hypothetical protein D3272_10650 [Lichenibacterium ramalinae]
MAHRVTGLAVVALAMSVFGSAGAAEPVMVQCGREYQAAKLAGTLGGLDWNRYRADCAARLKASPAAASPAAEAPVAAVPPAAAATPIAVAPTAATPAGAASKTGGGRAAATARQRQCGAEWRANKATLVAQTAGLTWPRYWSQCNTRLKAAGQ